MRNVDFDLQVALNKLHVNKVSLFGILV